MLRFADICQYICDRLCAIFRIEFHLWIEGCSSDNLRVWSQRTIGMITLIIIIYPFDWSNSCCFIGAWYTIGHWYNCPEFRLFCDLFVGYIHHLAPSVAVHCHFARHHCHCDLLCKWNRSINQFYRLFNWKFLIHRFRRHQIGCYRRIGRKMRNDRCNGYADGSNRNWFKRNLSSFKTTTFYRRPVFHALNRRSNVIIHRPAPSIKWKSCSKNATWNRLCWWFYWIFYSNLLGQLYGDRT